MSQYYDMANRLEDTFKLSVASGQIDPEIYERSFHCVSNRFGLIMSLMDDRGLEATIKSMIEILHENSIETFTVPITGCLTLLYTKAAELGITVNQVGDYITEQLNSGSKEPDDSVDAFRVMIRILSVSHYLTHVEDLLGRTEVATVTLPISLN